MKSSGLRLAALSCLTAGAVAVGGLGLTALPAAAVAPPLSALQPPAQVPAFPTEALASDSLSVRVATAFPQIVSYTSLASGATLAGTSQQLTTLKVNGTEQRVEASFAKTAAGTGEYRLALPDFGGIVLTATIAVAGGTVEFRITSIEDRDGFRVATLEAPQLAFVTVDSTQPGAQVSATRLSVDRNVSGDTFTAITAATPADPAPKGSAYALANTAALAAAVETNSLYDQSSGPANADGGRWWRQAVKGADGVVSMGLASGPWLYRAQGSPSTEELPWVKVAITADANADSAVDWQDAALALRGITPRPAKGDETADNVITHIPFNFASQATHPFLRTLDDIKRIALATDGLGQVAMLKGYTSEGHDSSNTDFGNNFNERAGGLEDLNTLAAAAKDFNAGIGVHINATEVYPEAKTFSDELARLDRKGWNWLDQSYHLDMRQDVNGGTLAQRIKELADATDDNLDFAYVDVYYEFGWLAKKIQDELVKNGFRVGSEWAYSLNRNNTWSHWANDESYGGSTNKGINSQILRFVNNTQSDTWNPDPRLGATHIVEFEGWTGETDYNAFTENVWKANLPAKFLQHHEIMRWTPERIDLADGVSVTGTSAADRSITVGGTEVLRGGTYLLPWSATAGESTPGKLYHYNPAGGETTWKLTSAFGNASTVAVYRLGDTGRTKVADVPVVNGTVTVSAEAKTPYVLVPDVVPQAASVPADASYGEGTPFHNPGFDTADLSKWTAQGAASVERGDKGHLVASLGASESSIAQELKPLDAGSYAASAWVEVQPGASRKTTLSVSVPDVSGQSAKNPAPVTASRTIDRSTAKNLVAADEKHGSYFQRVEVLFDVPANGIRPTVTLAAEGGDAVVRADDFRVVTRQPVDAAAVADDAAGGFTTRGQVVYAEDFEDVAQGWGPFIKSTSGNVNDPRTHLVTRNAPYTQKGWNGNVIDEVLGGSFSLIAHEENSGIVYRTGQSTVPFQAGRTYRVSFDYQSAVADQYRWVSGYDSAGAPKITEAKAIGKQAETARWEQVFSTGACGNYFVGLQKTGGAAGADLTVDNLIVEDLGPADVTPACADLTLTAGPGGTGAIEPGVPFTATSTLTIDEPAAVADAAVALQVPAGWTAEPTTPATPTTLAPGARLTTSWKVTPAADANGSSTLTAEGTYTTTVAPTGQRSVTATTTVKTPPAPPTSTVFASDHDWVSATNGWGPVERDRANGPSGANDGGPITLNGQVFAKGLGAHAPSTIRYYTGGKCTAFTAIVGVDDAQPTRGSITFAVLADGVKKAESPLMRPTSANFALAADITGARYIDLVVGDGGDGNGNDHADWADAKLVCTDTVVTLPPSDVLAGTPFVSDLPWESAVNGWGPAERDQANGEENQNDGPALKLDGVTYAKGIGAHADSAITVATLGKCQRFEAIVGVDDIKLGKGLQGSVAFIVKADGVVKYTSPVVSAPDAAIPVSVDISGAQRIELVLDRNGDDAGDDWGDWANARLTCA